MTRKEEIYKNLVTTLQEQILNLQEQKQNKPHRKLTVSVDFDGTIVEDGFPGIGKIKKGAKEYINKMYDDGYNILINTCRTGGYEGDAENFLRRSGINYHYINNNLPSSIEYFKQDCRKLSADVYIDDRCLMGLPETWEEIYEIVKLKAEKYYENK